MSSFQLGAFASGAIQVGANPILLKTNNVEVLRVDNAGNVGLKTSTPAHNLDVAGGNQRITNSNASLILATTDATQSNYGITFANSNAFTPFTIARSLTNAIGGASKPNLSLICTNATGSNMNYLTFTPQGNIGIQNTAPTTPLDITVPAYQGITDYGVNCISAATITYGSVPVSSNSPFRSASFASADGSFYLNGSPNNYMTTPTSLFNFQPATVSGGFTIEYWINLTAFTHINAVGHLNPNGIGFDWVFSPNNTGAVQWYYWTGTGQGVTTAATLSLNTWYHLALTGNGSIYRIFIDGKLQASVAYAGSPTISTAYGLTIGRRGQDNVTGNFYMTNLRIVTGAVVYSTASTTVGTQVFTPSTTPLDLAPSGSTQLLLRVPNYSNRALSTKIGGQSTQVFPPASLTADTTIIDYTRATYGIGTYIASSSSIFNAVNYKTYYGFDKNESDINAWVSLSRYTASVSPSPYTGSVTTRDVNGNSYAGEWLQIKLPVPIVLSSHQIVPQSSPQNSPYTFYILGSLDGVSWYVVSYKTGVTWPATQTPRTFTVPLTNTAYTYFRIVGTEMYNTNLSAPAFGIGEWYLYGTEESLNIDNDGYVGLWGIPQPRQHLDVGSNAVVSTALGIGTSNPLYNLDVIGTMNVAMDTTLSNLSAHSKYPYRIWDFAGTAADASKAPGYVSVANILGNVAVSTTISPFTGQNEGSIYLPGTTGSYMILAQPGTPALPYGAFMPDFTIETWIYLNATPPQALPVLVGAFEPVSNINFWSFGVDLNNRVAFYGWAIAGNGSTVAGTTNTLSLNTWTHIACAFNSTTKALQLFVNGTLQTLTLVSGTTFTVSTTTATFSSGLVGSAMHGLAPNKLILGQYNNSAMNCYLSSLRYTQSVLYTTSFIPSQYPIDFAPTGTTQVLLRVPLQANIVPNNAFQVSTTATIHGLPPDALIYMDCFGTNLPNLSGSNAPTFDTTNTRSVVFNRTASNYIQFPPQTFNVYTKGFTAIVKFTFTGTMGFWERIFDFGDGAPFNNILLGRRQTNAYLSFQIFQLNSTTNVVPTISSLETLIYQNAPITAIARYDPFTNGGTYSLWYDGILSATASNQQINVGGDRTINTCYVGRSRWSPDAYLNANIDTLAIYNRALTDKEMTDAFAVLLSRPAALPKNPPFLAGNRTGKSAFNVQQDGTLQLTGPITAQNNATFTLADYGVNKVPTSSIVSGSVPLTNFNPFNLSTEGSYYFNGETNNYINLGSNIPVFYGNTTQNVTFEAWVYVTQLTTGANMIFNRAVSVSSTTNHWRIYLDSSNKVNAFFVGSTNASVASANTVPLNTWSHMAVTVASSVVSIFINGQKDANTVTISGNVAYDASYVTTLGNYNNTANNMFYGYIACARIVSGSAAYTTSFTPSTTPLTGSPTGSTQLLLRAQQTPGRILINKLGGTTSTKVYPPSPLTGDATYLQNAAYANGTYLVAVSSGANGKNAFDKSISTSWTSAASTYATTTPFGYLGSIATRDAAGVSYSGEWLQIYLPVPIVLAYTTFNCSATQGPGVFYILGSTNGTTWHPVLQATNASSSTSYSSTTALSAVSRAYTYYRMVINTNTGNGGSTSVSEWYLYGTQESVNLNADGLLGLGQTNPSYALNTLGALQTSGNIAAGNIGIFRNRLINGDFRFNQRGQTSVIVSSTAGINGAVFLDRWQFWRQGGAQVGFFTCTPASVTDLAGFTTALSVVNTAGTSSPTWSGINQHVEGYNIADFGWGTASAIPICVSFWVKSSITGNLGIIVSQKVAISGSSYSYGALYPVYQANVWEYKQIVVQPPPLGTLWVSEGMNNRCLALMFTFAPVNSIAPGWNAQGNVWGVTGQTDLTLVNNATWLVTGVQIEKSTFATPYEFRPYALELALCQRYFEKSFNYTVQPAANTGISNGISLFACTQGTSGTTLYCNTVTFAVPKRTTAYTLTFYNPMSATGNARVSYIGNTAVDVSTISANDGTDLRDDVGFTSVITGATLASQALVQIAYTANAEF